MKAIIKPSKIGGTVVAPPSKSYTHRAIILASLAKGRSVIKNPLYSEDTRQTIKACQELGVKIKVLKDRLIIDGVDGHFPNRKGAIQIDCGLSGTTLRLMTAVSSLCQTKVILTGETRLRERPMKDLIIALKNLGINILSIDPLTIKGGTLKGGKVTISGETSSQFISALLLISPFALRDTTITIDNLRSKPYVDITIDLMKTFGVRVDQKKNTYFIKSGQKYHAEDYSVEGDFSSASYFFAAAMITRSDVIVDHLNSDSVQGDRYILEILGKMIGKKRILDLGNYPDIVPTVSIMASLTPGETIITNIGHLRTKESDRIISISEELKKMKSDISITKDSISIKGGSLQGAVINPHNDHRIAMSFAIAGLIAKGKTVIKNAEVVNKSYPNFWVDLKKIGARVKLI